MRTSATNQVSCASAHARLTQHFLKPRDPGWLTSRGRFTRVVGLESWTWTRVGLESGFWRTWTWTWTRWLRTRTWTWTLRAFKQQLFTLK